jgi:hypothetical protein
MEIDDGGGAEETKTQRNNDEGVEETKEPQRNDDDNDSDGDEDDESESKDDSNEITSMIHMVRMSYVVAGLLLLAIITIADRRQEIAKKGTFEKNNKIITDRRQEIAKKSTSEENYLDESKPKRRTKRVNKDNAKAMR